MTERILVIGSNGFIGQALCNALLSEGFTVRGISRAEPSYRQGNIETILSECKDPEQLEELLQDCQKAVYLAASSTPGSSAGQLLADLDDNLRPLCCLLEAMQSRPAIPLLYFSSAGALYGDSTSARFVESDPPQPKSYHGASKAAAENFIGAWAHQYRGSATILRPSNIYGPGQFERTGFGIIPCAFGAIRRREPLTVWGDGTASRDYLYIDDLVDLALTSLKSPQLAGVKVLNAASGSNVNLNELFTLMEAASGLSLNRQYDRGRRVDASQIAIDARQAFEFFGWRAKVSLAEGLERTWHWLNTTAE